MNLPPELGGNLEKVRTRCDSNSMRVWFISLSNTWSQEPFYSLYEFHPAAKLLGGSRNVGVAEKTQTGVDIVVWSFPRLK